MKTMNLYMKIRRTNQIIEIIDVRKSGQKTPKKIWPAIFRFFNSVNRNYPVGYWSPCFPFRYNGRTYDIKIFSIMVYDPGHDTNLYKMIIYK